MAIKKGVFENYIKGRESKELKKKISEKRFTKNKVFDDPIIITDKSLEEESINNTRIKNTENGTQKEHKATKNGTQKEHKVTKNGTQKEHEKVHKRNTKNEKKIEQNGGHHLSLFVGLQRKILMAMFYNCKIYGGNITHKLTIEHLTHVVGCKKASVKTTICRLRHKEAIFDYESKKGRAGWVRYEINPKLFADIMYQESMKVKPDERGSQAEWYTERYTERYTNSLSSSSYINNNITTSALPDDWKQIQYGALQNQLKKFGEVFGIPQLKAIYREIGEQLTASEVQLSIDNFVYTIKHNPTSSALARKRKIATLIETLKSGIVYEDYRLLEKNAEKQKSEDNEIKNKYFSSKFDEYFESLSDDEILDLVSASFKKSNFLWQKAEKDNDTRMMINLGKEEVLSHFGKFVWPQCFEKLKQETLKKQTD